MDESTIPNQLAIDELMEHVMPVTESGCWLWLGATQKDYGRLIINGQSLNTDKLCWESQHGTLPEHQRLFHKCHVRACINPAHLVPIDS